MSSSYNESFNPNHPFYNPNVFFKNNNDQPFFGETFKEGPNNLKKKSNNLTKWIIVIGGGIVLFFLLIAGAIFIGVMYPIYFGKSSRNSNSIESENLLNKTVPAQLQSDSKEKNSNILSSVPVSENLKKNLIASASDLTKKSEKFQVDFKANMKFETPFENDHDSSINDQNKQQQNERNGNFEFERLEPFQMEKIVIFENKEHIRPNFEPQPQKVENFIFNPLTESFEPRSETNSNRKIN